MSSRRSSDPRGAEIEVYAAGASGLTYNATTGVWHYNWQTKNVSAGTCIDMFLTNMDTANALFKFTK